MVEDVPEWQRQKEGPNPDPKKLLQTSQSFLFHDGLHFMMGERLKIVSWTLEKYFHLELLTAVSKFTSDPMITNTFQPAIA